jgi:hypothetical protein
VAAQRQGRYHTPDNDDHHDQQKEPPPGLPAPPTARVALGSV